MAKAMTLCLGDGCGALVPRGRCERCEREWKDARNLRVGPKQDTHVEKEVSNWRRIRANFMRRHIDPVRGVVLCECDRCAGLPRSERAVAQDVHHHVDRSEGGDSSDANLRAYNHGHHSSLTAKRMPRTVKRPQVS
jgi:hypothetical protein